MNSPQGQEVPIDRASSGFWTEAPESAAFAKIFDRDCDNILQVQRGLKGKRQSYVWMAGYQESMIRAWHRSYAQRLGLRCSSGMSLGDSSFFGRLAERAQRLRIEQLGAPYTTCRIGRRN